ncbi:MAG: hypothetical protein A2X56_01740 [Nitrospirae bacterium GWC2_57_13]|nr:MAG: hypothetical protein A2X56_01740 [Nitrospirae bacterium GWC2_57_13]
MALGLMALLAGHVGAVGTHMDVVCLFRFDQGRIEIAVLDVVSAAAEEVAGAAVLPAGFAHVLGDLREVYVSIGHTGAFGVFLVGSGGVVANETVYVGGLVEVETGVLPAVARVAARAAGPVCVDCDAEIIDRVLLSDLVLPLAGNILRRRPGPVHRLHEILRLLIVALETGLGHI